MLGDFADQRINHLYGTAEVLMVGDAPAPIAGASGVAIAGIHVDQVDVARYVELARAEFSHADNPQVHRPAFVRLRCAVADVQFGPRVLAGPVQRQLCQVGHGACDFGQIGLLRAIEHHRAFDDDLAKDAQGSGQIVAALAQCRQRLLHGLAHRHAFGQQRQLLGVAAVQALEKTRMRSGGGVDGSADGQIRGHGLCGKERRQ